MPGIKAYFRCMFRALRDIHARGIIHRDVKPANFLFDPRTGVGTLCDFGLASVSFPSTPFLSIDCTLINSLLYLIGQRMEPGQTLGACLHTPASREFPHGRLRRRADYDVDQIKKMQKEARMKSAWPSEKVGYLDKDTRSVVAMEEGLRFTADALFGGFVLQTTFEGESSWYERLPSPGGITEMLRADWRWVFSKAYTESGMLFKWPTASTVIAVHLKFGQ